MITVESLTKKYGEKTVVDDLNFSIQPGKVTGFLGPNGAGKSTTMRMIVGLDNPTRGTALIDGKRYADYPRPLEKVGTLLDGKWVHPKRSAAAHLRWLAASNGIGKQRVDEVLNMVGLSNQAGVKAGKFSLGMAQRLGIAAAMLGDPEVLILDEPVNGLDPEGIRWVRQFVRHLAAQGRSILISSHLLSEMAQTADHLVVIGRGKLVADSPTREFVNSAGTSAALVRTEHMDELRNALREENTAFEETQTEDSLPALLIPGKETDWVGALAHSCGLMITELRTQHSSLEDVFMQMTGNSVEYRAQQPTQQKNEENA